MNKVPILSIIVCLAAAMAIAQATQPPQGAWLQDGIKWSKAPKEINPKLSSGRAATMYFAADHSFALIYATVNRVPGEYEVICNGCGQVVYAGSWEDTGKTIRVKYRLVSRTVQIAGEQLPGPFKEDTVKIVRGKVSFLGHSFHRSTGLDASIGELVPRAAR